MIHLLFVRVALVAMLCLQAKAEPSSHEAKYSSYTLKADEFWRINLPRGQRFDASGLALDRAGQLFTVSDRSSSVWRISMLTNGTASVSPWPNCFSEMQLEPFSAEKIGRYDVEGIAFDPEGHIFICEESNRWILEFNPGGAKVTRLPFDWAQVSRYFSKDLNSSFEGLAIGDGKLYVANERNSARIIVVDLATQKITADFAPHPRKIGFGPLHYSDLSWYQGFLYVLCRHQQCIIKVNPTTGKALAEYAYRTLETAAEHAYFTEYPTGLMEGLAVDDKYFWLATDNNGKARKADRKDTRPTLFRCARPDVPQRAQP